LYALIIASVHATRPAHPVLLKLITLIIFGEEYELQNLSLCSFL
jgi:hypothetical protein